MDKGNSILYEQEMKEIEQMAVISPVAPACTPHSLAINSGSAEISQSAYNLWSSQYDKDIKDVGYIIPNLAAKLCGKYVEKTENASVLDVAGGTLVNFVIQQCMHHCLEIEY